MGDGQRLVSEPAPAEQLAPKAYLRLVVMGAAIEIPAALGSCLETGVIAQSTDSVGSPPLVSYAPGVGLAAIGSLSGSERCSGRKHR